VAEDTVHVYAGAKRRVRHPLARPEIPERPLPGR
jgi:glycogen(starch) synthase